jgi:hypothetical protein
MVDCMVTLFKRRHLTNYNDLFKKGKAIPVTGREGP